MSCRMATYVRWISAYELAIKPVSHPRIYSGCPADLVQEWWNKNIVQGPILEQATHMCKCIFPILPLVLRMTCSQAICRASLEAM